MQKKRTAFISAFMSSFFPIFVLVALLSCMTSRPVQARPSLRGQPKMDSTKHQLHQTKPKGTGNKKGKQKTQTKKKGKKSRSKR